VQGPCRSIQANQVESVNIVLLTGSELRHCFVRKAIALFPGILTMRSYCEGDEKSIRRFVESTDQGVNTVRARHLAARDQSEEDFFASFVALAPDHSAPVFIAKGAINDPKHADDISALGPDLLACYGGSLIRAPLLTRFEERFLNVHLGLSPYYRGAGTNFWPLVRGEPEFVGATFMHIDAGIDTGRIIHQIRARILPGDTPHQIGNRLIADMALVYADIISKFSILPDMPSLNEPPEVRVYRQKDFTEESARQIMAKFAEGLVDRYLDEIEQRTIRVPIIQNPAVRSVAELREVRT
jgi:phosphoribosylglycinamide formyltransferase 1